MFGLIEKVFAANSNSVENASTTAWLALAGGIGIFIWLFVMIIVLISFVFWLWMLIDCIRRVFPGSERTTWLVVLIVAFFFGFGWLGALIYLIVGRPKGTISESPSESSNLVKNQSNIKKPQKSKNQTD